MSAIRSARNEFVVSATNQLVVEVLSGSFFSSGRVVVLSFGGTVAGLETPI